MQELNYKPNNLARGLQGKSGQTRWFDFPKIFPMYFMPNLLNVLRMNSLSKAIKPLFVTVSMILTRRGTIWKCLPPTNDIISSSHNLGIEDYEKVEAPIVAF